MNSESFLEIPQRGTGEGVCATAPRGSRSAACHVTLANGQHLPVAGRVLTPCTRVCDCAVRMGTEESQTKEQGQRAAELRRAKRGRRDLRMASCQSLRPRLGLTMKTQGLAYLSRSNTIGQLAVT